MVKAAARYRNVLSSESGLDGEAETLDECSSYPSAFILDWLGFRSVLNSPYFQNGLGFLD